MSEPVGPITERKKQDENPLAKSKIPQRTPQQRSKFYNRAKPTSAPTRDNVKLQQRWEFSTRLPRATNTSRPNSGPINNEKNLMDETKRMNVLKTKGKPIVVPIIKQALPRSPPSREARDEVKTGEIDLTRASWAEKLKEYEEVKLELGKRKKSILKLYEIVNEKYDTQDFEHILADDMQDQMRNTQSEGEYIKGQFAINLKRLYSIPTNLVNACEKILLKHKTIADWLETLTNSKELAKSNLLKKINEFNSENEVLNNLLIDVKSEYLTEITQLLRKGEDPIGRKVRNKLNINEVNYPILNSMQTIKADGSASYDCKLRVEELEKNLEEQKSENKSLLNKFEEKNKEVKELEDTLKVNQEQADNLVLSIKKLQDENKALHCECEEKLGALNEIIVKCDQELCEVSKAKDELQKENTIVIRQRDELVESLQCLKGQIEVYVQKIAVLENKYACAQKEKDDNEKQVESLSVKILETELRYKDFVRDVKERERILDENCEKLIEFENTKNNLRRAQMEIEDYVSKYQDKCKILNKIEEKLSDSNELVNKLQGDITRKDNYISELESKHNQLERQILISDEQMESYEKQMVILKDQLMELQEEFEKIRTFSDVQIEEREAKLLDITKQNMELTDKLKRQIEHKDIIIKELTAKERDQSSLICHFQHTLEKKIHINNSLNSTLKDKDDEIRQLVENLNLRKKQVDQLKNIFVSLDEPNRKLSAQRKIDQRRIIKLQKKLAEYQGKKFDSPQESRRHCEEIETIVHKIESELDFSPDRTDRKRQKDERTKLDKIEKFECHDSGPSFCHRDLEVPSNICVKRAYLANKEDIEKISDKNNTAESNQIFKQSKSEFTTDRSHKLLQESRHSNSCIHPDNFKNIRNDKKCKMFKFAGHQM